MLAAGMHRLQTMLSADISRDQNWTKFLQRQLSLIVAKPEDDHNLQLGI
jgi:hypothetical protein